jgi:hypothetical protein
MEHCDVNNKPTLYNEALNCNRSNTRKGVSSDIHDTNTEKWVEKRGAAEKLKLARLVFESL